LVSFLSLVLFTPGVFEVGFSGSSVFPPVDAPSLEDSLPISYSSSSVNDKTDLPFSYDSPLSSSAPTC